MHKSFKPEAFYAAINEKDYIKLKNYIINSIRNNPGFYCLDGEEKSEARKYFIILKEKKDKLPELFSEYKIQEGEKEFDESLQDAWDYEYFIRQTFLLEENFCEKRFNHVRKIGKYLEKKKKANFNSPQEENEDSDYNVCSSDRESNCSASSKIMPRIIVFVIIPIILLLVGKLAGIKLVLIIGVIVLGWLIYIVLCMKRG